MSPSASGTCPSPPPSTRTSWASPKCGDRPASTLMGPGERREAGARGGGGGGACVFFFSPLMEAGRRARAASLSHPPPPPAPFLRLFGYGLGLHLIHGEPLARPTAINPRGDHLSFQVRRRGGGRDGMKKEGDAPLFFFLFSGASLCPCPSATLPPRGPARAHPPLGLPSEGESGTCPASRGLTLGPTGAGGGRGGQTLWGGR